MVARIVALAAILAVLALYLVWTARRLDRLHARVDAAAAALAAQLDRRSAAVAAFAADAAVPVELAEQLTTAADAARAVSGLGHDREVVENAVSRALAVAVAVAPEEFVRGPVGVELHDDALRASIARGFYNDAVRDALVVRDRRVVRWLGLAGHAAHPAYFEMADEELPTPEIPVTTGPTMES